MTAQQLSPELYDKLCSLNYRRKPNSFFEAYSTFFLAMDEDVQNAIKTFPVIYVDPREDLMGVTLDGAQQFYVIENEEGAYLVDTQGYDYPRYIIELIDFNSEEEDDSFERISGLARLTDVAILQSVVKSLALDLEGEGFERVDIINFIDAKILDAIWSKKV